MAGVRAAMNEEEVYAREILGLIDDLQSALGGLMTAARPVELFERRVGRGNLRDGSSSLVCRLRVLHEINELFWRITQE
jgi:hypothetical protein